MAIVEEAYFSREQSGDGGEFVTHVFEVEDELEAIDASVDWFNGLYPSRYLGGNGYNGLDLVDYAYERVNEDTHTVTLSLKKQSSESDVQYNYSTRGGSAKMTQALLHLADYAAEGFTPPNFYGAIGVTKTGIEGVEVPQPQLTFSEVRTLPKVVFDAGYGNILAMLTGSVNLIPWRGFAEGELRFDGVDCNPRNRHFVEIDYAFSISRNVANLVLGNVTIPFKYGWDYLWLRYVEQIDEVASAVTSRVASAHLERVYPWYDFNLLLLG